MDDVGSIYTSSHSRSKCLPTTRHVPEYSWHFGSRGRPYTIYSPAYRTFSPVDIHARRSLSLLLRDFVYTREIRLRHGQVFAVASWRVCEPRAARRGTGATQQVRFAQDNDRPRPISRWNFSEVRNCRGDRLPGEPR